MDQLTNEILLEIPKSNVCPTIIITRVNWNFLSFGEGDVLVETGLGRLSELLKNLFKKKVKGFFILESALTLSS